MHISRLGGHNHWPIVTAQVIALLCTWYIQGWRRSTGLYSTLGASATVKDRKWFGAQPRITFSFNLPIERIICLFKFLSSTSWTLCGGHRFPASCCSAWVCIPVQQHDCHISVWQTAPPSPTATQSHPGTWGPDAWKWPPENVRACYALELAWLGPPERDKFILI